MSSEIWELVRPVQEKGPKPNKTNLKMTAARQPGQTDEMNYVIT